MNFFFNFSVMAFMASMSFGQTTDCSTSMPNGVNSEGAKLFDNDNSLTVIQGVPSHFAVVFYGNLTMPAVPFGHGQLCIAWWAPVFARGDSGFLDEHGAGHFATPNVNESSTHWAQLMYRDVDGQMNTTNIVEFTNPLAFTYTPPKINRHTVDIGKGGWDKIIPIQSQGTPAPGDETERHSVVVPGGGFGNHHITFPPFDPNLGILTAVRISVALEMVSWGIGMEMLHDQVSYGKACMNWEPDRTPNILNDPWEWPGHNDVFQVDELSKSHWDASAWLTTDTVVNESKAFLTLIPEVEYAIGASNTIWIMGPWDGVNDFSGPSGGSCRTSQPILIKPGQWIDNSTILAWLQAGNAPGCDVNFLGIAQTLSSGGHYLLGTRAEGYAQVNIEYQYQ